MHTHTHMYTYTHTFTHACIHTYIHTYIYAYMHTHIYTYIHTYIHAYIHTHIFIHTYIYTHMHTHKPFTLCVCYVVAITFLKVDPYIQHKWFCPRCFVIYVTNLFGIMDQLSFAPEGEDRTTQRNVMIEFSLRQWAVHTICVTSVAQLIGLLCIF